MRLLLWLVVLVRCAWSFDLTWIPADAEGPLPLSQSFRDQLSKLCDIIESGAPIPPTIESRLSDLKKMCAKLRNEAGGVSVSRLKPVLAVLSGTVFGAWAWTSYETKGIIWDLIEDQRKQKRRAQALARRRALAGHATLANTFKRGPQ